jgi:hypothetical protein
MKKYAPTSDEHEFVLKAYERYNRAYEHVQANYNQAIDDLTFLYEDMSHWTADQIANRDRLGQTTLQIDVLQKYTKQVNGEGRRSKVKIKVRPVNSDADIEVANIRAGKIKDIEYMSNAETIYDYARKMVIDCGYGAWRILTRPKQNNPFEQEIYMDRIRNPFTVFFDPEANDINYADAKYAFIMTTMTHDTFKEKYPDNEMYGIDGSFMPMPNFTNNTQWHDKNTVSVIEYFYTETKKKKVVQLMDGRIMEKKEAEEHIKQATESYDEADTIEQQRAIGENREPKLSDRSQLPAIRAEAEQDDNKIMWCRMTAGGILEKTEWAGKYIPIVLARGEVIDIDGRELNFGLIHNAKDAQKSIDYWHSAAAENIALAPKAPYMGTAKMFQGYEKQYARANKENLPFMLYNPDKDAPGLRPERSQPPTPPAAIFSMIMQSEKNVESALGMFKSDVGDQGRELSGVAIQARQLPGDTSTYVFLDNLSQAIAHSGRIINDLIPKIYDTEQDMRLRSDDDSESFAPVNTTVGEALKKISNNPRKYAGIDQDALRKKAYEGNSMVYNDITSGEYDVVIETGPSFQTQRQEAAEYLQSLTTASTGTPLFNVMMYFATKYLDFDGAQELADAVRKTLPQGVLPPKPGEEPPKPPPPTPQEQMMMQAQKVKLETDMIERQVQLEKLVVEAERRRTEQIQQIVQMFKAVNESQGNDDRQLESAIKVLETQLQTTPKQMARQSQRQAGLPQQQIQGNGVR